MKFTTVGHRIPPWTGSGPPYVRLSIMLPEGDYSVMVLAAGHSLPGQTKSRQPISASLSRFAYHAGQPHQGDDVTQDERFAANPKASRPMRSMVSLPLWSGDAVVGHLPVPELA